MFILKILIIIGCSIVIHAVTKVCMYLAYDDTICFETAAFVCKII